MTRGQNAHVNGLCQLEIASSWKKKEKDRERERIGSPVSFFFFFISSSLSKCTRFILQKDKYLRQHYRIIILSSNAIVDSLIDHLKSRHRPFYYNYSFDLVSTAINK